MKNINIMIKPASSLCNMRCKYCFYGEVSDIREVKSYGIMTPETMGDILRVLEKDLENGDRINFAFQGGEPTLAGIDFFKTFVSIVKGWRINVNVSYALQTNATLIDENWCMFLKDNNFLVGVSFDILQEYHDEQRATADGKGTYKRVLHAIQLLEKYKVEYNVLCTLTNSIARYPKKVWDTIVQLNIKYVQFTPCLGNLKDDASTAFSLTPNRFAQFYTKLFQLWYEAYKRGKYVSIKLFDDIINLMVLKIPTSCGINGYCKPQLVVEADGSVYPCDFYCLDEYKLGNIREQGFAELLKSQNVSKFLSRPHTQPLACDKCRYSRFCGGNCQRMQKEICSDENSSYCGYRNFLDKCSGDFIQISNEIIMRNIEFK